ncbi:MAG TPA: hypothetical protein VI685_17150, partial [Candidatus Angelobacter sp.]
MKSGFRRITSLTLLLLLTAVAPAGTAGAAQNDVVIRNVRIFDGTRVIQKGDVWVQNGLIKAAGTKVNAPSGVRAIDGTGDTLL